MTLQDDAKILTASAYYVIAGLSTKQHVIMTELAKGIVCMFLLQWLQGTWLDMRHSGHCSTTILSWTIIISSNMRFIHILQSTAGGILGFILALLVETLLFIIKTSSIDQGYSASSSSTSLKLKKNQ
ncbi:hypothetical protein Dimus_030088 [Dionaea muscipula]